MTRVRVAMLAAIGLALACGVIAMPVVPLAPTNTCGTDEDCASAFPDSGASAACTGSACVNTASAFRPILVVDVPTTAPNGGGVTFALPDNYILELPPAPPGCANIPASATCFFLPPIASVQSGVLQVGQSLGRALWPPGGLRPNMTDQDPTTLPTRAVFHPMWIDPVSGNPMLATLLGLPLPDLIASQTTSSGIGGLLLAPTNGTSQVPGFVFSANLPQPLAPTDPSIFYALDITPSAPYDVFPPLVRPIFPREEVDGGPPDPMFTNGLQVSPPSATLTPLTLNISASIPVFDTINTTTPVYQHTLEIDEAAGAVSLQGWNAYFVDVNGRRVSGLLTLGPGPTRSVIAFEAYDMIAAVQTQTLVIAPPPTLDMPSLQVPGNALAGAHTYEPLPAPPNVSGAVQRSDQLGVQVSAHVTFFANGLSSDATLVHADSSLAPELDYQKIVATDASGNYATTLPPGSLRAYVVPDDPTLAITLNDFVLAPSPATQTGKTLLANPRTHVKGRVVLANGTPVYAANVVISPSADLPLTPSGDDPLLHPRETQGTTDVNGMFDVPSDPGQVDISIRPQDGTQFPWVVLTSRTVSPSVNATDGGAGAGALTLATITIPLPTTFPPQQVGVLTDALGNPLANTMIRAYAFPPAALAPDGGTVQSRGARLLGATTSDESGNFQLFLAPPDPE